ncbi:MAG: outer membrane lipoprotein-sorting protein [Cyclobacteriaceae bacterium]|nr:outer membrane lipoprotein-sorting protein [Cyclobacteriaceae bacterium]
MKLKISTLFVLLMLAGFSQAQTVDEIIDTYFENIGGADNFRALTGITIKGSVNTQGMEIPLVIIQLKGGKQLVKFELQGKKLTQLAFDGEVAWGHNFMTMQAEKQDSIATENLKRISGDFPDPFLDYKDKGYKAELVGEETVEGVECFKIKLTKKPTIVDDKEEEDVSFYFFDKDNNVPIVMQSEIKSGQMKGMVSQTIYSDYEEVGGMYFAFSQEQGLKDQPGQVVKISEIILNPEVDMTEFVFPEE